MGHIGWSVDGHISRECIIVHGIVCWEGLWVGGLVLVWLLHGLGMRVKKVSRKHAYRWCVVRAWYLYGFSG